MMIKIFLPLLLKSNNNRCMLFVKQVLLCFKVKCLFLNKNGAVEIFFKKDFQGPNLFSKSGLRTICLHVSSKNRG